MINAEWRFTVCLKQPRVKILINQNINSQNMKVLTFLFRICCFIEVMNKWMESNHKIFDEFSDLGLKLGNINTWFMQIFPDCSETSFTTSIKGVITISVRNMILVQTIICKMNIRIIYILFCRLLIRLGTQSSQSLLIKITNVRLHRWN